MKQRIVAPRAVPSGSYCLSEFMERPCPPGLHVVPTTAATLVGAAEWASSQAVHVVGLQECFGLAGRSDVRVLTPALFLEACRHARETGESIAAVVFSDQFVSAEFAPILVRRGGALEFFPSLETIAAVKYALPVHCWGSETGGGTSSTRDQGHLGVIRALSRYYEACGELGQTWLMRDRQVQRLPADRIENAKRRLRLYQSILMLSSADGPLPEANLAALKQLGAIRSGLPDLQWG